MLVDEALEAASTRLVRAGVTASEWDAQRLLRHVLGWDQATLLTRGTSSLSPEDEEAFFVLVVERAKRRPLQHLVGTQSFWYHEFLVSPDALIPRPETELLLEAGLAILREIEAPVVVDVGTGTGNIALSLAAALPQASVHATDISPAALAVAEQNRQRLELTDRVRYYQGDLLEPVAELSGRLDLVIANPPYADPSELPGLEPEVRDHEPRVALVPPGDRLAIYTRLVPQAARVLRHPGWLAVELGAGMHADVSRLFVANGFEDIRILPDLQGIERVVLGRRP